MSARSPENDLHRKKRARQRQLRKSVKRPASVVFCADILRHIPINCKIRPPNGGNSLLVMSVVIGEKFRSKTSRKIISVVTVHSAAG